MREINSAENLTALVEGDIAEVDGVLQITKIRMKYHVRIPVGKRESVDRALATYSEKCPAYQSVKKCIECTWEIEVEEV